MSFKEILGFIVVIAVFVLFFYGLYRLMLMMQIKRAPKLSEERLMNAYKGTRPSLNLILCGVAFIFFPLLGIMFFFLNRKMHKVYGEEIIRRGLQLPNLK